MWARCLGRLAGRVPALRRRRPLALRRMATASGSGASSTPLSSSEKDPQPEKRRRRRRSRARGGDWKNAGYVPRNLVQRTVLAMGSSVAAFLDPTRADLVATLGETTGRLALQRIHTKMQSTLEGRTILSEKPRVDSDSVPVDVIIAEADADASGSAARSFGYAYAKFMTSHGYAAEDRDEVRYVEDAELAYVMQRYREVHDFWHVLTGIDTSVEGEVGQKFFEFLQTGLPMAALSSAVGPLRLDNAERLRIVTAYAPWAWACHQNCTNLMGVYYENYLDEDLDAFRKQLGIVTFQEYNKESS